MNTRNFIWLLMIVFCVILFSACREDPIEIEVFGTIQGQVFDDNTLLPVIGAEVSTNPASSQVNTDSLGVFSLENVLVGTYSLKAIKEGYLTEYEPVTVVEDKIVVVNINLAADNGENQAPIPPQLISPEDGSFNVLTTIELIWTKGEEYTEEDLVYDVTLINENAEEIVLATDHKDTSLLVENLKHNTNYFWYVTAKDGVNLNANSNLFAFRTTEVWENLFLFVRKEGGLYQIYSSDLEGSNEARMTNNLMNHWAPRFSPDGTMIAYISVDDNSNHIYVMDADGNNARKVTSGIPINYYHPHEMDFCWSPDGTKILYMNFEKMYLQDINVSGGPPNSVFSSPDGRAFASVDWKGNYLLVRTTNSEGFETTLYLYDALNYTVMDTIAYFEKGRCTGPYFSKSGNKIVYTHDVASVPNTIQQGFQSNAHIFLINQLAAPYDAVSLSAESKPTGTNDISARFSPSGAFIVFTNQNIDGLEAPSVNRVNISDPGERTLILENALMPDWRNP